MMIDKRVYAIDCVNLVKLTGNLKKTRMQLCQIFYLSVNLRKRIVIQIVVFS